MRPAGNTKPEEKLEENGGGREGVMGNLRLYLRKTRGGRGGLEMFLRRENEKNLRYLLTVPYVLVRTGCSTGRSSTCTTSAAFSAELNRPIVILRHGLSKP